MVCARSALPGTIQLGRRLVTAWVMLRSFICSLRLCDPPQPQPPLCPPLPLSVSSSCIDSTAECQESWGNKPTQTFSVLLWRAAGHILCCGGKKKKKKILLSRGSSWRRQQGAGNGEPLHLYIVCERCWQATVWEGHSIRSQDGSAGQPVSTG